MKLGKMLYRGTIAVDIDGVLANFEGKFCEDFGDENRHLYSLEDRYPQLDPQLIREYVSNPENYRDLEPIFGGALFCHQAKQRGWKVLLLTSRGRATKEVTVSWLKKYSIEYDDLFFAKNKLDGLEDYNALNPTQKVSVVVDDSPNVLNELYPYYYTVAWSQPWNNNPRCGHGLSWYDFENMKIMLWDYESEVIGNIWRSVK